MLYEIEASLFRNSWFYHGNGKQRKPMNLDLDLVIISQKCTNIQDKTLYKAKEFMRALLA